MSRQKGITLCISMVVLGAVLDHILTPKIPVRYDKAAVWCKPIGEPKENICQLTTEVLPKVPLADSVRLQYFGNELDWEHPKFMHYTMVLDGGGIPRIDDVRVSKEFDGNGGWIELLPVKPPSR